MTDYIVGAVILLIIVGAVWYVIKAKKSGKNAPADEKGKPVPGKGKEDPKKAKKAKK